MPTFETISTRRIAAPSRAWSPAVIGGCGVVAVIVTAAALHRFGFQWRSATHLVGVTLVYPVFGLVMHTILTPAFAVVVAGTLLLERLAPADAAQPVLSRGLAQDLVWFFYEIVQQTLILATWVALLTRIYHSHFNALTIRSAAAWPPALRFVAAVLLLDLLYWCQHYTNHKVAFCWRFHAVHHSQRELNFFTDFRYHVVEYLVRHTWLVVPFLILDVNPPVVVTWAVFSRWYSRFYHGNIRTNLGPLRYLLVTPQSHRVHHSIEDRHHDRNFGSIFSIWDRLFGTQYHGADEYPVTGIVDAQFPHETGATSPAVLIRPLVQSFYPFRGLFRGPAGAAPNAAFATAAPRMTIEEEIP